MFSTVERLFKYLPFEISRAVHSVEDGVLNSINEIRLRKNAPISLTTGRKNLFIDRDGHLCGISRAMHATEDDINECMGKITGGSLYTCDEFIARGFVPLPEGGRAGVCGRAAIKSGKACGFAEIYSINLRLHRFIPDFASRLIGQYNVSAPCGTLVCSPPAYGKTTFLRSAAYLLSAGVGISARRVGIADERAELSAGLGTTGLTDIISGMDKADAINILTRTMSPEIIVCDEISANEVEALLEAQNTGVVLIASAHCSTPRELLHRGRMKQLLQAGIFPLSVILGTDGGYGYDIVKTENFL